MILEFSGDILIIQREKGDPAARTSGFTRDGWSREHHLMHHLKQALQRQLGIELVKVNALRDGHLLDDRLPILRPATPRGRTLPKPEHNIGIYHEQYMLRSAAEDYNRGDRVRLDIVRDYWHPTPRST